MPLRSIPAPAGINPTEGQVFQYTFDLTKKRKGRRRKDTEAKLPPQPAGNKDKALAPPGRQKPREPHTSRRKPETTTPHQPQIHRSQTTVR